MKGREGFLKIVFFLLTIVPATWSAAAYGATLTVCLLDSNTPCDYQTIQEAINKAGEGDTVLVADGTYTDMGTDTDPDKRDVNLIVNKPIKIIHEGDPKDCTIEFTGMVGRAITFTGDRTEGAVLSGFTIKGGNGVERGGGILCEDGAAPTIDNCIISGNAAKTFGGGIACDNSSPFISNCHIEGNIAVNAGGGLYLVSSSPRITGSTIMGHKDVAFGGGIFMGAAYSSPNVPSCPSISSCIITGNSALINGGAFYCKNSSPLITNCTVADNKAKTSGGGFFCTSYTTSPSKTVIANTILWNNSATTGPEIYVNANSTIQISYSRVKEGKAKVALSGNATLLWSDDTNKDIEDPGFVGEGDYHLLPDSPCVEAGTKEGVELPEYDIDGDLRISGSNPDIGADETRYSVKIDVRPGSRHDKIDLRAWGFLPVAVLSTPDFDATSIDPETVEFAGAKPLHSIRAHVNRDRRADMLFFFWIRHLDFGLDENSRETPATIEVALFGDSKEKGSIIGTDTVTIINPKHKRHWWSKFEEMSHKKGQCNSK